MLLFTLTVLLSDDGGKESKLGLPEMSGLVEDCLTITFFGAGPPVIVSSVLRSSTDVFSVTLTATVLLPEPLSGLTVHHDVPPLIFHETLELIENALLLSALVNTYRTPGLTAIYSPCQIGGN